ncbi:MAG TPA: hypothetical protein VGY99_15730 [Candidatus Binataceae bacterium]|jgi:hypothetical protein|nr:hypothetical protein [Candidatus Binataceae bacterium]
MDIPMPVGLISIALATWIAYADHDWVAVVGVGFLFLYIGFG